MYCSNIFSPTPPIHFHPPSNPSQLLSHRILEQVLICVSVFSSALKEMDLAQLNELLEELDNTFREFSEILVQQLALREEMEDEKEMKNMFIASLLSVQNKIKSKNGKGKGKSEGSSPGGLAGLGLISRIKGKNGLVEPGYVSDNCVAYAELRINEWSDGTRICK